MPAISVPGEKFALDSIERPQTAFRNIKREFEPPKESRSGPHPALIFGCVAIVMAIVFTACVFCARRRMKRRQARYNKLQSRISASHGGSGRNGNRNGLGQGTFPGYQYDHSEGGYKYAPGYRLSDASDPDGPPPAYSSQPSSSGGGFRGV